MDDKRFPVIEIFGPTIQGEGNVIGMQTMFIRFGGCDYRCTRCDSLHAVLPGAIKANATRMTGQEIYDKLTAIAGHCRMVTFSGGNPLMWDLMDLVVALERAGWQINVETQGTVYRQWVYACHYVTTSPKSPGMGVNFEPDKYEPWAELAKVHKNFCAKIVIFDQRDIEFAKEFVTRWPHIMTYLSMGNPWPPQPALQDHIEPEADIRIALLERMVSLWDDVQKEPILANVRFLPQLHTLLWGNEQCR